MCLRFVFLLIKPIAGWLRLSRREEAWKIAEILILRHQLAVLQRQQRGRVKLCWADRALLAALLSLIPKAQWYELRLLVTPGTVLRCRRDIVRRREAWSSTSILFRDGSADATRTPGEERLAHHLGGSPRVVSTGQSLL